MRQFFRHLLLIFALTIGIGSVGYIATTISAEAQSKDTANAEAKATSDSAAWSGYLKSAEQALNRNALTDAQFGAFDIEALKIIGEAQAHISALNPEYEYSLRRLEDLGPKPKEDEPQESEETAELRTTLGAAFAKVDGQIKDARQIIVRATELRNNALKKRRAGFVNSLTSKARNVLMPSFWLEFVSGFSRLGYSFSLLIEDSLEVTLTNLGNSIEKIFGLIFGLVLGTLVFLFAKRKITEYFPKPPNIEEITRIQRAIWAAANFFRRGLLYSAGLIYLNSLFSYLAIMPPRFQELLGDVVFSLSIFLIAKSLAEVFLSPKNEEWRITDLTSPAAERTLRTIVVSLALITFLNVLDFIEILLVSPFEVSVGLSALVAMIGTIGIVRILVISARDRMFNTSSISPEASKLRWVYLRGIYWAGAVCTFIALILSYTALAEFIILQLLTDAIILAVLWLILELIDTNRHSVLITPDAPLLPGAEPSNVKKFSILGFGILKLLVVLIAVIIISLPWGYRTDDWMQWLNGAFFGFQIGDLSVSISTILQSITVFIVGYIITKMLQTWLSSQFLPATNIESGLRNSISTVLGYIGYALAAMLAVRVAGLDLSNLAIVAGALSVGVGFGLQSIISNFVSGLILLAERPIKIGDWIITGGGEGTVRKISVRSTEIQTFDRATIVVPNSILITDPVTNWTHTSKLGRIKISIGVGYDSDPDQVRDILLECLDGHKGVLKSPKPSVFFLDFGDNALLFEVRGFLSNIENGLGIRSDLRFSILRALRTAKIEIPYPQQDVHIKSEAPAAAKPATRKRVRKSTPVKK